MYSARTSDGRAFDAVISRRARMYTDDARIIGLEAKDNRARSDRCVLTSMAAGGGGGGGRAWKLEVRRWGGTRNALPGGTLYALVGECRGRARDGERLYRHLEAPAFRKLKMYIDMWHPPRIWRRADDRRRPSGSPPDFPGP